MMMMIIEFYGNKKLFGYLCNCQFQERNSAMKINNFLHNSLVDILIYVYMSKIDQCYFQR